jgi:hypothetical protein
VGAPCYFGSGVGFGGLCSQRLVQVFLSPRRNLGFPESFQLLGFDEGSGEVHEGGMQRLCAGLPHERSYTGVALGKVHAPRMHILPEMRRRMHNKSHQTKNALSGL